MESTLTAPPLAIQLIAALFYGGIEYVFLSLVAKIVCDWRLLQDIRPWMSQDDVLALIIATVVLGGIWWIREKTRLNWFLIGVVSLLVTIAVCLHM